MIDAGESAVASESTDGDGEYGFAGLTAGAYIVDVDAPAGFGLTAPPEPRPVTVAAGDTVTDADFGYQQIRGRTLATIGDFVWNDLNRDGIQDANEPGSRGRDRRIAGQRRQRRWRPPPPAPTGSMNSPASRRATTGSNSSAGRVPGEPAPAGHDPRHRLRWAGLGRGDAAAGENEHHHRRRVLRTTARPLTCPSTTSRCSRRAKPRINSR